MSKGTKRNNYKQKAEKTYAYYRSHGTFGIIRNGWNWLLADSDRLTALSTFAIFLATAVAVGVGIAQWRALHSTDQAIHGQLAAMEAQLKEMKSSGEQTDALIKIYTRLADATAKSADAATKQSENSDRSLIEAQRAWVGPQDANIENPVAFAPLKITVSYNNTGRQPAPLNSGIVPKSPSQDLLKDCKAFAA